MKPSSAMALTSAMPGAGTPAAASFCAACATGSSGLPQPAPGARRYRYRIAVLHDADEGFRTVGRVDRPPTKSCRAAACAVLDAPTRLGHRPDRKALRGGARLRLVRVAAAERKDRKARQPVQPRREVVIGRRRVDRRELQIARLENRVAARLAEIAHAARRIRRLQGARRGERKTQARVAVLQALQGAVDVADVIERQNHGTQD